MLKCPSALLVPPLPPLPPLRLISITACLTSCAQEKLDSGWKFDKKRWDASVARHAKWNMAKVFKLFDFDGARPMPSWDRP